MARLSFQILHCNNLLLNEREDSAEEYCLVGQYSAVRLEQARSVLQSEEVVFDIDSTKMVKQRFWLLTQRRFDRTTSVFFDLKSHLKLLAIYRFTVLRLRYASKTYNKQMLRDITNHASDL